MEVNYNFVPEFKSKEIKYKSDVVSYAGKLLEIVGATTLVVSVREDGRPFVLCSDSRLIDSLDISLDSY